MSQDSDTRDREIVVTRVINAPRELVFQAWTQAVHVRHWYGPNGFSITTHEMDVRPGGVWRFTMHGPDGRDYPNRNTFREIAPPERLVTLNSDDRDDPESDPNRFEAFITFDAIDARTTRLTMRSVFLSREARDFVAQNYGAVEGALQTIERLAAYLAMLA